MSEEKYTFLLVGKTGAGKSALGNTIVGKGSFQSSDSCNSVTSDVEFKRIQKNGYDITVADTPGFMDTELNADEAKLKPCEDMKRAMSLCSIKGKNAVILVIKYGERFTLESMTSLYILESIFGKENLWKSCVIAMTHGEVYDLQYKEGKKDFKDYVREQKGPLGLILEKCNYKCALFHNLSDDLKEEDFTILMQYVQELDQGYTRSKFKEAKKHQNRLALEAKMPQLNEEFQETIKQLTERIQCLQISCDSSEELEELDGIITNCLDHVTKTDSPDKIAYREGEKRLLEDIRYSFSTLHEKIMNCKEKCQQMKIAQEFITQIENIKKEIKDVGPNDEKINKKVNLFQERLNDLSLNIRKVNFSKELSDNIQITLNEPQKKLDELKSHAQQKKQSKLISKLHDIKTKLHETDCSNENAGEILFQMNEQLEVLTCKLNENKGHIDKGFINLMEKSLKECEETVTCKQQATETWVKIKKFDQAISEIALKIQAVNENEHEAYSVLCNFQKDLDELFSKAAGENLGTDGAVSLNLKKNKAEEELKDKKKRVQQFKFKLLDDKIKKINDKLDLVNHKDSDFFKKMEEIEKDTIKVRTDLELEKPIISESISDTLELLLNQVQKSIQLKKGERLKKENANDTFTLLDELKINIMQTDFKCHNIFDKISAFKKNLTEIELLTLNCQFNDVDKKKLLTTTKRCLNDLDELKSQAELYLNEKICSISTKISLADPADRNINEKLLDIFKGLETLKAKKLQFLSDGIKECEFHIKQLLGRTKIFLIFAEHYDALATEVENLVMPCKVHHYETLLENTNSLLTRVKENIKNETDRMKLSEKIFILLEVIKKLEKKNKWAIAGKFFKFALPGPGFLINYAMTSGNAEEEQKQKDILKQE